MPLYTFYTCRVDYTSLAFESYELDVARDDKQGRQAAAKSGCSHTRSRQRQPIRCATAPLRDEKTSGTGVLMRVSPNRHIGRNVTPVSAF